MNKYPIYIVSKGRYENPITAKMFIKEGVDFRIVVEPQEYEFYKKSLPEKYILATDFSNLGLGSFPARNFAWEDSIKRGFKKHYCFDDNIYGFKFLDKKKKRINVSAKKAFLALENFTEKYTNVGLAGFNYYSFTVPKSIKKPFFLNRKLYSAMLIDNSLPFRWRLKYNEDVDLCLNTLSHQKCIITLNVFSVHKVSTTMKLKGGNQTELYKGNSKDKKILKAKSLEKVWPNYVKTTVRFNRPHHYVYWEKFKVPLIKKENYKLPKINLKLCINQ